jgi:hypothetical protein
MSNYLDRLESELLSAGRRHQARPARAFVVRGARRLHVSGMVPVIVSLAVTAVVVAVVLATGIIHGSSQPVTGQHGHGSVKPVPGQSVQPKVTRVGACRSVATRSGLPPLVMSDAAPSAQLSSILSMARDPTGTDSTAVIRGFDRNPSFVLTVFRRFIRVVNGERGVRVAFFPAVFCQETDFGPRFPPTSIRVAPEQGIITLPLYGSPKVTAAAIATASLIRSGFAVPGLDTTDQQWMQAVIVPDGVAKVVMHFTPPFLHHYSATALIHDNIGIVVRRPDYFPTSVSWYAADGHLIRTFVDKKDLQLDNCLRAHRKNCN